jgi:hypothetical protein
MGRARMLKRRSAVRKPKSKIFIFCEGKRTEPDYFSSLASRNRDRLTEIVIVESVGVPLTIVNVAKRNRRLNGSSSFQADDEYWVVFDRDDHPNYQQAITEARQAGLKLGNSNPCFEYWLLLHFVDHNASLGRHDVQRLLSKHSSSYSEKSGKICDFKSWNLRFSWRLSAPRLELFSAKRKEMSTGLQLQECIC